MCQKRVQKKRHFLGNREDGLKKLCPQALSRGAIKNWWVSRGGNLFGSVAIWLAAQAGVPPAWCSLPGPMAIEAPYWKGWFDG